MTSCLCLEKRPWCVSWWLQQSVYCRDIRINPHLLFRRITFSWWYGIHAVTDVIYDAVIKLIGTKMYCSDNTKTVILNNTARMIKFYGGKGFCPMNYSLVFNWQIYPHIGLVSEFSQENRMALEKITDVTIQFSFLHSSILSHNLPGRAQFSK